MYRKGVAYMQTEHDKDVKYRQAIENDNMIIQSLMQWVLIEHERKSVSDLFIEMGYDNIAIYGHGYLGQMLEKILRGTQIEIECIMDRRFTENGGYYRSADGKLPVADIMVVTVPYQFESIRSALVDKGYMSEIHSIDDFLFQL